MDLIRVRNEKKWGEVIRQKINAKKKGWKQNKKGIKR